MKKALFTTVILVIFSSCLGEKNSTKDDSNIEALYEINLSDDFPGNNRKPLQLSDIVEDVEYVQLETTNKCLIDERSFYAFTDKDIYVLSESPVEQVFRFDRITGKFIMQIGQNGMGPKDMLKPSALYAEKDFVYASSITSNKVYTYHKDGEYVRTVSLGRGSGKRITAIQDKYIIRHQGRNYLTDENNYKEGNPNEFFPVTIYDMEGNALFTKCDTLIGEDLTYMSLDMDPRRWYYNGQLNFYNEIDNTVYAVNEKGVTPRYKFNLGKNKWVVTGRRTKKHLGYIKFHTFKETTDYLYIYWNQNKKAYFARFDKKTNNLDVQEETPVGGQLWHLFAYGPKNDIDGCGSIFGPGENYEDKTGSFVFEITPNNIDRVREVLEKAQDVKFPEKRQQLLKMLDERKEDDNPILVIYKLKK